VRDVPSLVIRTPRFSPKCRRLIWPTRFSLAPDSYLVSKTKIVYWQNFCFLAPDGYLDIVAEMGRILFLRSGISLAAAGMPELGRKVQEGSVAAGRPL